MSSDAIPVHTSNGIMTVEGERTGPLWAVTKQLGAYVSRGRIWRVTHIPSGLAVIDPTTKEHARRIARALNKECADNAWQTIDTDGVDRELKLRALEVIVREGGVNKSTRATTLTNSETNP